MKHKNKKSKFVKKLGKIFNRNALIFLVLLLQAAFVLFVILNIWKSNVLIYSVQVILSFLLVCYVVNKRDTNPAYKIVWTVLISLVPMVGGFMYIFLHVQFGTMTFKNIKNRMVKITKPLIPQCEEALEELSENDIYMAHLANYVNDFGHYPIYKNTSVEYYKVGEEKYTAMMRELEKAEKFIFMEYFIIDQGKLWDSVLEILERKAAQGVEVRLLYDGMGSQIILPGRYNKYLESKGIKCRVFNEFRPFLSTAQNNRDHRKILVIDGVIAFNGGINLADEYINEKERFGHWKDTAVMIKGDAVWSYTVMFIQMWEWKSKKLSNYEKYKVNNPQVGSEGYVLPYGDSPTDTENVGKLVYMDIINKARDYVYITTPYLVLDNEIITAMEFAVKSGVDVKIIVPHIADKWYVNLVGWNFYRELIGHGVEIYEYMPGFIHAKNFVSDDNVAVVGTINLDFRSLYLHFECATLMYKTPSVEEIKRDFTETLSKCRKITLADCAKRPVIKKIAGVLLRIIAPLL